MQMPRQVETAAFARATSLFATCSATKRTEAIGTPTTRRERMPVSETIVTQTPFCASPRAWTTNGASFRRTRICRAFSAQFAPTFLNKRPSSSTAARPGQVTRKSIAGPRSRREARTQANRRGRLPQPVTSPSNAEAQIELHRALAPRYAYRYGFDFSRRFQQDWHAEMMSHVPRGARRVLDLGCGTGFFLAELDAKHPGAVGLDISHDMLKVSG